MQGSCLRVVGEGTAGPGDAPAARTNRRQNGKRPPICHCEEAAGRRGALSAKREEVPLGCNLGKAAAISPKASPRSDCVLRDCHVASLLAMTRQGSARCTSALLPLNIPYKAVTDRRYRRNRSVRFYRHLVRTGSAFPRLPRAQSALAMTNRGPLPF